MVEVQKPAPFIAVRRLSPIRLQPTVLLPLTAFSSGGGIDAALIKPSPQVILNAFGQFGLTRAVYGWRRP